MARKLARTVTVQDPDTRRYVTVLAGTEPPARLAELITNPAAWGDGTEVPETAPEPAPTPAAPAQDGPPARNDPKDDWIAYAVTQGLSHDEADGMTKADLVDRFGD